MNFAKAGEQSAPSSLKMDMSFGHDSGGDFSLPDYLPEIQRLLSVTPTVLPETKFLSGNVLELGGTMSYSVLYYGDDNTLACTSLVSEYNADTALPVAVENVGDIICDCDIENTTCRVTGPRSLNIKTRLKSRVMSDETVADEGTVIGIDDKKASEASAASVERLRLPVTSMTRSGGMTTGSATGEMTPPSDASKPVLCEGTMGVSYAESRDDGVLARGDIYVKCIFAESDGKSRCRKTKIPFEILIPVRNVTAGSKARAWGRVASVTVMPSGSADGSYSVSAEYDIEGESLAECETTLCCDAYSTELESENEMREAELLRPLAFGGGQLTVSSDAELKNVSPAAFLVDIAGGVGPLQVSASDGKLTVAGSVKFKAIIEGESEMTAPEFEIPVKYEIPDRSGEGVSQSELQSRVSCAVLKTEGKLYDGKISVNAELCVSYEILEKQKKRFVTAVKLGAERKADDGGTSVRVYFPQSDESLWSVCKKYHADRGRILRANNIEGDRVKKGKPIIIYR